ncbi:MAG: aldo/keto reductase [Candidatus Thorarchaeota archaeon]|nr:MAG: aldo/keto reductase [Candidatus Thorarchaeota archaeon]
MKYRRVGKSGLKISEISLGSWPTYGGTVDDQTAKDCLSTTVEHGINFIDSAEIYSDTIEQIEGILDNTPEFPRTYRPNIYYQDRMRGSK